jgi:ABC-type lipoprotein release transport system permease subunit
MRAVTYVVRAKIRSLAGPSILLSVVVGIVLAVVIALAAGARRTETVPARVEAAMGGAFDYVVTQEQGGRPMTDAVGALPGIQSADSYTFVFGGLAPLGTTDTVDEALVFAGTEQAFGARIVAGRALDQGVDDEFVATRSFVAATGAAVGDKLQLYTITQEQAAAGDFGKAAIPTQPTLTATLVGVMDASALIEDPTPFVLFPKALIDRPEIGISSTMISVRLDDGTDESALRRELADLPSGREMSVDPAQAISPDMTRAIRTQARGTWLLALVAGVAAVVALTQVITRQTRASAIERETMSAIGFSDGQAYMEAMTRAAPPIVAGGLLAAALSISASAFFPTGEVRRFEPDVGVLVDWRTVLGATALLIAALLLSVGVALAWTPSQPGTVVPSPVVDAVATRSPLVPAAIGIRLGFTRARGERGSMRAALAGVFFTVGGLVAAITFGASLDRLIDQPFRYGWNMDVNLGDNGGEHLDPEMSAALESDPNVEALVYYAQAYATTGAIDVPLMGMERARGHEGPLVLSGRLPVSEDEIAFGRVSARRAHVGIGDEVTLAGATGSHEFTVVGLVVVTGLGSNEGIGQGAVTTVEGLRQVSDAEITSASVNFRSSVEDGVRPYADQFDPGFNGEQFVPAAITSMTQVRSIPYVLAGLLGLLVVVTIAHMLLTSLRARQRDLAIVRALGAAPATVRRAVHWQATLVTLVPALIGVPLGLVAGRLVFKAFADDIGAINSPALPSPVLAAVLVGVAALANLVAMWPARMARRWSTAAALRRE